jgi:hypothetical protein
MSSVAAAVVTVAAVREVNVNNQDSQGTPPDTSGAEAASKYAADLGYKLGSEQTAEAKRQYEENKAALQPVLDAQLRTMNQTATQGQEYYDYMKSQQRPVEAALNAEAMGTSTDGATESNNIYGAEAEAARQGLYGAEAEAARQEMYGAKAEAARGLFTGGNAAIQNDAKYGGEIASEAATAGVDQLSGYSRALNIAQRQGMRYGYSPEKIAAQAAAQAGTQASSAASATNQARGLATDRARMRIGAAEEMRQSTLANSEQMRKGNIAGSETARQSNLVGARNLRLQDANTSWAKKLDTAGLYRGLPGASAGAYGASTAAGNSVASNTMAPGQLYSAGMKSGADTAMTGAGTQVQGLTGVLASKTSAYNNRYQDPGLPIGQLAMAGATAFASDRRLKENIELVGVTDNGYNWYEFNYRSDKSRRYRGVMAHEVMEVMPEAVSRVNGYLQVDYGMLGLKMEEVL